LPDLLEDEVILESLNKSIADSKDSETPICRICFAENSEKSDPLISPCNCAGTMKFIHALCLKEWLKTKVASRISEKGMSFYIKDLVCELCNYKLPSTIFYNTQRLSLLDIAYPTNSYIIFEEYDNDKKTGFHLMSLTNNSFGIMGRGNDTDIKISDISVSRVHCKIKYQKSKFYLEDCQSKFGTLVKLKKKFLLKPFKTITLQINRTILVLTYKETCSIRSCFCCFHNNKVENTESFHMTQSEFQESHSEYISGLTTVRQIQLPQDIDS
jgi:Protein involved in mRNA turnover and stability